MLNKILTWLIVLLLLGAAVGYAERRATCPDVVRDKNGKIARSAKAKRDFRKKNPCPATGLIKGVCPGYVIDHIVPLKNCGPDDPKNMQWLTVEAAKIKDRME